MADLNPSSRAFEQDVDESDIENEDPWPRLCEILALILAGVLLCALAGAVLAGVGYPISGGGLPDSGLHVGIATRLRFTSQYISALDGLFGITAVLLVAFEGIASGTRPGASTTIGKVALYGVVIASFILAAGTAARSIDVMAGQVSPVGPPVSGHVALRIGSALFQVCTSALSSAACWLAFRTLGDTDRTIIDALSDVEDDNALAHVTSPPRS